MIPEGQPNYLRSRLCIAASRAALAESEGALEEAAGLYAEAARGLAAYGWPFEEAHAQLGAGRCLLALGRDADARPRLDLAREIAERLHVRPMLAEIEGLEATGEPAAIPA
jgi:hypothetical protein